VLYEHGTVERHDLAKVAIGIEGLDEMLAGRRIGAVGPLPALAGIGLDDRMLVTPTLIKLAPLPVVRIASDLSHQDEGMFALGLTSLTDGREELRSG